MRRSNDSRPSNPSRHPFHPPSPLILTDFSPSSPWGRAGGEIGPGGRHHPHPLPHQGGGNQTHAQRARESESPSESCRSPSIPGRSPGSEAMARRVAAAARACSSSRSSPGGLQGGIRLTPVCKGNGFPTPGSGHKMKASRIPGSAPGTKNPSMLPRGGPCRRSCSLTGPWRQTTRESRSQGLDCRRRARSVPTWAPIPALIASTTRTPGESRATSDPSNPKS